MRKLYDLEKEKICWKPWMISGVGIWTGLVAMGLLLFAVACPEGTGGGQSSEDLILFSWEGQIALLSALDFACGSIFAAALASRVVVRDYGKDYASVLLLYPMNRKRMFRAKELLISLRTVLLCLPALLIATGILAFVAAVARVRLSIQSPWFWISVPAAGLLVGLMASAVGMISAYAGWKRKSQMASIVCGILIVCLVSNGIVIMPKYLTAVLMGMAVFICVFAGVLCGKLEQNIEKMEV